mmetsp:Transcript_1084/g.2620  ORF Transcript_1084/g.2620 Transcript_1084/m.2620 type:complete len:753 (+) Transcript_1084:131-2389(+)
MAEVNVEEALRKLAAASDDALAECKFDLQHVLFGWPFLLRWMAILGALSAFTEFVLGRLEYIFREQRTNIKVLRRMYRELTVLGIISFALIVIRDASRKLDLNDMHLIEFAHLWLFTVGITFIITNATVAVVLRASKSRWDDAFAYGLHRLQKRYEELQGTETVFHRTLRYALPFHYFEMDHLMQKVHLWVLRRQFIDRNKLPESFHFSKYLRRSLTRRVLSELKIGWISWAFLGFCFLLGYGISSALDEPLDYLNLDSALEIILVVMLVLLGICFILNKLIHLGLYKFLHKIAGVPRPYQLTSLIPYCAELNDAEQSSILDPTGRLTADEVRLDEVLAEVSGHDKLRYSTEFATRNLILDMINVETYTVKEVLPVAWAVFFTKAFRILILAQGYAAGFTILVIAQYTSSVFQGWRAGATMGIILIHCVQVGVLIPFTIRNYALLSSVARVEQEALDVIEGTFFYQKEANDTIYILSSILYNATQLMLNGVYQLDHRPAPRTREEAIREVFMLLDSCHNNGVIPPLQLQKALQQQPFRRFLKSARLRMVFRSLNCTKGFTMDRCRFLVLGFDRLEKLDRRSISHYQRCFAGSRVKCHRCHLRVPVIDIEHHADTCRGPKMPGFVSYPSGVTHTSGRPESNSTSGSNDYYQSFDDEANDNGDEGQDDLTDTEEPYEEQSQGSHDEVKHEDAIYGSRKTTTMIAPATSYEGSNEDNSETASSTIYDRASIKRDAQFGLLLPFLLPKSRLGNSHN